MYCLFFPTKNRNFLKCQSELSVLGLFAIALTVISFRAKDSGNLKWWSLGLLIFICCQGLFGYLTVSLKLLPIIVTLHLFGGFTTLCLFFFIFLKAGNFELVNSMRVPELKKISFVAFIFLIFQIFLGVWTSTNYASLACVDFPTCQGTFFPDTDFKNAFDKVTKHLNSGKVFEHLTKLQSN